MMLTITITKTKLALSILVAALLVPATAWASHVFDDVPDDKFYAGPVEWAYDNNITTGKTATSFAPDDNVTRGESVTFLQRYHDNIVDPAIGAAQDAADAATQAAESALAAAETAQAAVGENSAAIDQIDAALVMAPVGYATVLADGTVVPGRSAGVTDANVTREATSAYCFYDLDFDFTVVQAMPTYDWDTTFDVDTSIEVGYPDAGDGAPDCNGDDPLVEISTAVDSTWAPHGFTIVFFG